MIYVDESEPVGETEPQFPHRKVIIKRNRDVRTDFDMLNEIGRGKFGRVMKCREYETGEYFAAKFVLCTKREERRNVEREVEIMNLLKFPTLLQLYDAYDNGSNEMCILTEYIGGGELFDRVIEDEFVLTEKACVVFMKQILEGVSYIHKQQIIHLDLKPENILCLTKSGNRIKIIDFGLARKHEPMKKLQVLFGTPEFVAPEVVNFEPIGYATDMWAIGVICYVLLSGLSPFMGDTDLETMANVTIAEYDYDDEAFDNISDTAKDFIDKLLVKEKCKRASAEQCLKHPWFCNRNNNNNKANGDLSYTKEKLSTHQKEQSKPNYYIFDAPTQTIMSSSPVPPSSPQLGGSPNFNSNRKRSSNDVEIAENNETKRCKTPARETTLTLDQVKKKAEEICEQRKLSLETNNNELKPKVANCLELSDQTLWQAAERTVTPLWEELSVTRTLSPSRLSVTSNSSNTTNPQPIRHHPHGVSSLSSLSTCTTSSIKLEDESGKLAIATSPPQQHTPLTTNTNLRKNSSGAESNLSWEYEDEEEIFTATTTAESAGEEENKENNRPEAKSTSVSSPISLKSHPDRDLTLPLKDISPMTTTSPKISPLSPPSLSGDNFLNFNRFSRGKLSLPITPISTDGRISFPSPSKSSPLSSSRVNEVLVSPITERGGSSRGFRSEAPVSSSPQINEKLVSPMMEKLTSSALESVSKTTKATDAIFEELRDIVQSIQSLDKPSSVKEESSNSGINEISPLMKEINETIRFTWDFDPPKPTVNPNLTQVYQDVSKMKQDISKLKDDLSSTKKGLASAKNAIESPILGDFPRTDKLKPKDIQKTIPISLAKRESLPTDRRSRRDIFSLAQTGSVSQVKNKFEKQASLQETIPPPPPFTGQPRKRSRSTSFRTPILPDRNRSPSPSGLHSVATIRRRSPSPVVTGNVSKFRGRFEDTSKNVRSPIVPRKFVNQTLPRTQKSNQTPTTTTAAAPVPASVVPPSVPTRTSSSKTEANGYANATSRFLRNQKQQQSPFSISDAASFLTQTLSKSVQSPPVPIPKTEAKPIRGPFGYSDL